MNYGWIHVPRFQIKINKDFEWGMLETLTSKNGYTDLAKCELKKNEVSVRIGALCDAVNFIKHFAD